MIQSAKHTLKHVVDGYELLTFVELEAAMMKAAEVLNQRPISARVYAEDDFYPVCPGDMLLGRINGYSSKRENIQQEPTDLTPSSINLRMARLSQFSRIWRERWLSVAFRLLCPFNKWSTEHRNLCIGDIVLLKSEKKLGKDLFRLGRVSRVLEDEEGIVRTVEVGMRSRKARAKEAPEQNKAGLDFIITAIQKLVVILPVEEQWKDGVVEGEGLVGPEGGVSAYE